MGTICHRFRKGPKIHDSWGDRQYANWEEECFEGSRKKGRMRKKIKVQAGEKMSTSSSKLCVGKGEGMATGTGLDPRKRLGTNRASGPCGKPHRLA